MLQYADICKNLESFQATCAQTHATLVLASKTIPQDTMMRLASDYEVIYGENRVQELCDKYFEGPTWMFIGRLQRNKVKYLVDKVSMICSVDSVELATEIERRMAPLGRTMPVLVEVNCGEEAKGGVPMAEADALVRMCQGMAHLEVRGLMAVLPIEGAEEAADRVQALFEALRASLGLSVLSMGMSEDYAMALRHGSTMIRIGSAVFGRRS